VGVSIIAVSFATGEEYDDLPSNTSVMMFWKREYMQIIDAVLVNLKFRFSNDILKMANSVDSFCKMDFTDGSYFIYHYKVKYL